MVKRNEKANIENFIKNRNIENAMQRNSCKSLNQNQNEKQRIRERRKIA
jgi:hypothetical protein